MKRCLVIFSVIFFSTAAQLHALPVTYNFTGTVDYVASDVEGANTPYGFLVGQTMTGSFTYDVDAVSPPAYIVTSGTASWSNNYNALTDFTMTIGAYTASDPTLYPVPANIVQVLTSPERDSIIMGAPLSGPAIIGDNYPIGFLSIDTPLSDTALANVGDLSSAPITETAWYLDFTFNMSRPSLSGTLTTITMQSVPEPACVLLLGVGLAALAGVRLRNAK